MQKHIPTSPAKRAMQEAWSAFHASNYKAAIEAVDRAIKLRGDLTETSYLKAHALSSLGRDEEAMALAVSTRERFPDHPGIAGLVGVLEAKRHNFGTALPLLKQALDALPKSPLLWQAYCGALVALEDYHGARLASEQALKVDPDNPFMVANYASALRASGELEASIVQYQRATELMPDNKINRSNHLLALLSDDNTDAQALHVEARKYAEFLSKSLIPVKSPLGSPTPRIRVGILSADFRRHACAYFLIPLIANLDRSRFDVVLCSLNPTPDMMTERIRQFADEYIDVADEPEDKVVETLRAARVDVMIDLGGYTGISPLSYMVHRLAPTQITWLGYPGSSGMQQIDYRITDAHGDPEGFDAHYSETLLRAPLFCAYHPHVIQPLMAYEPAYRVQPTPAQRNGFITFGSCNNIAKLTGATFKLWAAVLARCPDSRLLVEAAGLNNEDMRNRMALRMQIHGIDTERVIFFGRDGKNQYLTYNQIDIALDTTPYTGGTTTCDALWMGVPVITLAGDSFGRRISVPFLRAVGLDALVCDDEASYVDAACALAADVEQLDALRQSLRARVEHGQIADARAFAEWFEATLYDLVRERKQLPEQKGEREEGIFFAGQWYSTRDMVLSLAAHLHEGNHEAVRNIVENLSSVWYRHWIVSYALAVVRFHDPSGNRRDEAMELLLETIGQRPYALPLYRLLADWLDQCGLDKSGLAGLLDQQFGLTLETLESSPVPSSFEVIGIEVEHVTDSSDNQNTEEALA